MCDSVRLLFFFFSGDTYTYCFFDERTAHAMYTLVHTCALHRTQPLDDVRRFLDRSDTHTEVA